jgi:hypothetical protein
MAISLGCGVKAPPIPYYAPTQTVQSIRARALSDGVEVAFTLPVPAKPEDRVVKAELYYNYLPIVENPDCKECPQTLPSSLVEKKRELQVASKEDALKGGDFIFLDKEAPLNMMAVYQVVLIDAEDRKSTPSPIAGAPRLPPPAAPLGVKAMPADGVINLAWAPVTTLANGQKAEDIVGYVVFRSLQGVEQRVNDDATTATTLSDRGVVNGQTYHYRVATLRKKGPYAVLGPFSDKVKAVPGDVTPPSPPTELLAVSTPKGIFLRFAPSPEPDVAAYVVMRRIKQKGGEWENLTPKPITENGYVDEKVKIGGTYLYKVKAVDRNNNMSKASEKTEILHQP